MTYNTGETDESLRQEYNYEGSILRLVQQRMLDMVLYIDHICKVQGFNYRIDGGTVLGAVRHGGFIPWDDDIDIALPRKDWEKLCKYLRTHPHPQYVFQNHETDPGFYQSWAKLRDTKSEYTRFNDIEAFQQFRGAQVDLFCFDEGNFRPFMRFAKSFEWINVHYLVGRHKYLADFVYKLSMNFLCPLLRFTTKIFGSKKYEMHAYGAPWMFKFPKSICWPAKPIMFEGCEIMGPADPIALCKLIYGERYYELPLKERREVHADVINVF